MNKLLYYSIGIALSILFASCSKTLYLTTNPAGAKLKASKPFEKDAGRSAIKLQENQSVVVTAQKEGYIDNSVTYNYKDHFNDPEIITLEKDEAYNSSFSTDLANNDIQVKPKNPEDVAWKKISQICTGYFDVIEVIDKNSGYLRTAWESKSFNSATIRTRLIIKTGSLDPLTYKAKIVSEFAPSGTSVKDDERFQEWDRVLKKYEPFIEEFQSRL